MVEALVAYFSPLVEFLQRQGALVVLLFVLIHKIGDTLANLTLRLLFKDLGFSNDEVAFYDVGVGFVALLVGIFVGGILYARLGMKRSVLISLVLMAVSNLSFAALAAAGHTNIGMAAAIGFENFASGIGGVTVVAYLSALCNLRFTATQYALLSALASIAGRFLTGTTAGALIERDRLRQLLPADHAGRASRRGPVLVHDPLRARRPVDRLGGQGRRRLTGRLRGCARAAAARFYRSAERFLTSRLIERVMPSLPGHATLTRTESGGAPNATLACTSPSALDRSERSSTTSPARAGSGSTRSFASTSWPTVATTLNSGPPLESASNASSFGSPAGAGLTVEATTSASTTRKAAATEPASVALKRRSRSSRMLVKA